MTYTYLICHEYNKGNIIYEYSQPPSTINEISVITILG